MSDRTAKRTSDDCIVADVKKKKKISKEKREEDVLREKPVSDCNGDTRQKKAFFAYFGKSFVEDKDVVGRAANSNGGNQSGNATKKSEIKNNNSTVKKKLTSTDGGSVSIHTPTVKNTKPEVSQNKDTPYSTNMSFIKYVTQ